MGYQNRAIQFAASMPMGDGAMGKYGSLTPWLIRELEARGMGDTMPADLATRRAVFAGAVRRLKRVETREASAYESASAGYATTREDPSWSKPLMSPEEAREHRVEVIRRMIGEVDRELVSLGTARPGARARLFDRRRELTRNLADAVSKLDSTRAHASPFSSGNAAFGPVGK